MEVRSRAPGKIIVSGEHAVVHGSTAVAASVDLCTHTFLRLHDSGDKLTLFLKDMSLQLSWSLEQMRQSLPNLGQPVALTPKSCSQEVINSIIGLLDDPIEDHAGLSAGIWAFIWLYTCIQGFKPGTVVVTSDLPLGSGLGSSAAFCVSLSAALLALSDSVSLDFGQKGWVIIGERELELVNKWAFEGEKIIHGKPSGIDNTVSTYGEVIKFKAGNLLRIKTDLPLKMLVTNTQVKRNTKALVSGVFDRSSRHPDAMDAVFKAVDSISTSVCAVIQSDNDDDGGMSITDKEDKLAELMEMNQGLLQCMGVSHASIETVLRTTLKYNLVSKLTGAGGGGCVLTLLPSSLSNSVLEEVISELESCGFQCFVARIGRTGVEICFDDCPPLA